MTLHGRARTLAGSLIAGLALLLVDAAVALADTAANPPPSEPTNNIILAVVALGVLGGVLLLTRPKRGPR